MSVGLERSFQSGKFEFTPRIAAHHVDDKYVNYYYGVRAEEATASRPFHIGQSTTQIEAGFRIGYALAPRHRLSLDLNTTRLGSAIQRSPLVDRTRQNSVRAAYLYLF
jgi:outer membrane protein